MMVRCLRFQILNVVGLYYLCCENKGVYHSFDLHLFCTYAKSRCSHGAAYMMYMYRAEISQRYIRILATEYRKVKTSVIDFDYTCKCHGYVSKPVCTCKYKVNLFECLVTHASKV